MEHSKKRILIADDDPAILDVLTLFLEDVGYEVDATEDGSSIRDFPNGIPDLMLLDIWLSGWSGRDICLALKSQKGTCKIPIILISANNEVEKIARNVGADDFLAKPFDLDDVIKKIEYHL